VSRVAEPAPASERVRAAAREGGVVPGVALLYQPYKPEALRLAEETAPLVERLGYTPRLYSTFDLREPAPPELALALTFGGDGTILRAARWLANAGTPIVGVKLGRLSFLGELAPPELPERLGHYLAGDYWLDERAMLQAEVNGQRAVALNDVVLGRGASLRAMRFTLAVDGAEVTRYVADGIILATATGSTAYALAAGGPVLAPELRDIVVRPIVPHLTLLQTLVLPPTARIGLHVASGTPASVAVDGQELVQVADGDEVCVSLAPQVTRFARRGKRAEFYGTLASRLAR
jgi:NAD+ kinase